MWCKVCPAEVWRLEAPFQTVITTPSVSARGKYRACATVQLISDVSTWSLWLGWVKGRLSKSLPEFGKVMMAMGHP